MREPKIRFVEESDLIELIQLCELHAIHENSEYDSTNKREQLDKHLFSENPRLLCLVVEYLDNIIGYATYMRQFSTWDACDYIYMDCLFIKEDFRSLGLGDKLVREIKIEAEKMKCNLIQWQTPKFNIRAMNLYYRIGATSKTKERFFLKFE